MSGPSPRKLMSAAFPLLRTFQILQNSVSYYRKATMGNVNLWRIRNFYIKSTLGTIRYGILVSNMLEEEKEIL